MLEINIYINLLDTCFNCECELDLDDIYSDVCPKCKTILGYKRGMFMIPDFNYRSCKGVSI